MEETLLPLDLPPGLFTNGTPYSAKGRWGAGNLVRFFEQTIRPVGGWRRLVASTGSNLAALAHPVRAARTWRDNSGAVLHAYGSISKLQVVTAGALADVTPSDFTTAGVADSGPSGSVGAYGKGGWGVGPYSEGSAIGGFKAADTWQFDVFGEQLAAVFTGENLLRMWDGDPTHLAATAAGSPSCLAVVTTAERFLVALGADGDGRQVWWANQETSTEWDVSDVDSLAGNFPLSTDGVLMAGRRIRGGTLLFTDLDVWLMTYLGDTDLIFSFRQVGDHCGLIAPNAVAVVDGRAMWMGSDSFYGYDGGVVPVPCEVSDSVFGDLNYSQRAKIFAVPYSEFGEVHFFYPSGMSAEIDSYVIYSYRENHWSLGKLARTAGATDGPTVYPLMVGPEGYVYEHETGSLHDGAEIYAESGPVELAGGDNVFKVQRIVPDEKTQGDVSATLYTAFYPNDAEVTRGPFTLSNPTSVRFTARQVRVRFTQVRETTWRIGKMRLGVVQGGRR